MAGREVEPVGHNEHGDETHPAFGMIGASRVSGRAVLFDSDVEHQHFVVLRIGRATRRRDLHRDWIHSSSRADIVEVAMSEAQWASMISSMNTSGVPCTIRHTEKDGAMPSLDFESRLDLSHKEVKGRTEEALAEVLEAFEAVKEKPTKANIRTLEIRMGNLPANMQFAATSLTEHAETVVQKSRADVEAFVINKARQVGLNPDTWEPIEELEGAEDRKELEQ